MTSACTWPSPCAGSYGDPPGCSTQEPYGVLNVPAGPSQFILIKSDSLHPDTRSHTLGGQGGGPALPLLGELITATHTIANLISDQNLASQSKHDDTL